MYRYEVTFMVHKHSGSYTHTVSVWAESSDAAAEILSRQLRDPHEIRTVEQDQSFAFIPKSA